MGNSSTILHDKPELYLQIRRLCHQPLNTHPPLLRKMQAKLLFHPFRFPQGGGHSAQQPSFQVMEGKRKVPLLKATATKDYLRVLYEAISKHNQFSHSNRCSSPPNKSQVQASLLQGQGKFSQEEFHQTDQIHACSHAPPHQG